jgi:hypothetical protein
MRPLRPFRTLTTIATVLTVSALAACINPQDDYEAFIARAPAPDAQVAAGDAPSGEPCMQVLAGPRTGTFYGACLTTAASGDVTQATYVKLDISVDVNPDGASGTLTTAFTSLKYQATNVSDTVGPTQNNPPVPITKDCTYVIDAGTTNIPSAAYKLNAALTLSGTRYRGKLLTPDSSCSALDATLTSPVMLDLTTGGNYCVFRRAPPDGSITLFKKDDYTCPGAPPG